MTTFVVIINLGGEGEVPGAVNINSFDATLVPIEVIRSRGPLIQARAERLPIASGVAARIEARRFPVFGVLGLAEIAAEAFRVLQSGGVFLFNRSVGPQQDMARFMLSVGFTDVEALPSRAQGVKP